MNMLLAGTDVSGFDDQRGQHKVISIIVGTEEAVNHLHKNIGLEKIHMRTLKHNKRDTVRKNLMFNSSDIIGLSLTVGENRIVHEIFKHRKLKEKYASLGAVYEYFDHLLLNEIKGSGRF